MRKQLLIVLLVCTSGQLLARKVRMSIQDAILTAELIVVGTIADTAGDTYTLTIDELVHGQPNGPNIRVRKWKEWTCDSRNFKIEQGQRLVLLLKRDSLGYAPINESTGEIVIRNDSLAPHYQRVRPMPLADFTEGIRIVRCHYKPDPAPTQKMGEFCSQLDWDAVRRSDGFAAVLIRKIEYDESMR